jgi:hypothetical protein
MRENKNIPETTKTNSLRSAKPGDVILLDMMCLYFVLLKHKVTKN